MNNPKYTVRLKTDGSMWSETNNIRTARADHAAARRLGLSVVIRRESDGAKMCDQCRGCDHCTVNADACWVGESC